MRRLALALALLTACRPAAHLSPAPAMTTSTSSAFTVVVLGARGGLVGDDLSAYLVAARGTGEFVCLDAGTLYTGLARARERGAFADLGAPAVGVLLRDHVRAYLISHPHLDHLAGLVLASPDDSPKPIAGLASTLAPIRDHLFNHAIWANFTDAGPEPRLGKYHLLELTPGAAAPLPGTRLSVEAWPLSHAGGDSTAFLVHEPGGRALLYLGDTGPDAVEGQGRLARLWARVAPLAREGKLRAVFLEVSYPDPRPDAQLFGHLTPTWLARELRALAAAVDPRDPAALRDLAVVVTHIKPGEPDPRPQIAAQLAALDLAGARLLLPSQGDRLEL